MKNVALITGASSGIGAEFARIHAQKKGDVVIVARRVEKLTLLKKALEEQYQIKVKVITKDLTLTNAPKEIYDELIQDNIHIEYLINNAGFGGLGKFNERPWESDLQMINLNIIALTALTRLFLPDFITRNSGKILNVSSTASLMPGPLQAVYFATKAYVTSFSNALTEELYHTNVSVTTLLPGATETEFAQTSGMDKTSLFNKTTSAYKVAKAGYEGMIDQKMNVVAGLTFIQRIMIAAIPFTPKKIILKQVRNMQEYARN